MGRRRRSGLTQRDLLRLAIATILLLAILAVYIYSQGPGGGGGSGQCEGTARCFTGTVTAIVDGDTLDVDDIRIRLALVNTPEQGQPGYDEATAFTASVCPVGSQALVDEDDGQTEGSYGRIVARVTCGTTVLNAALVESGHGEILTQFCDKSEFADEDWASACG